MEIKKINPYFLLKKPIGQFGLILLLLVSNNAWSQNSLIIDGGYIRMNGGVKGTPVYLVIDQSNPSGIVRTANGGHIHSENQWNFVLWNAATSTGNYVYPFGVAGNATDYIPFTFNKTTSSGAMISISTWATNSQNIPHPDTSNLPAVNSMNCFTMNAIGDSVTAVIDRFWDITSSAAVTADLTFSYLGTENTTVNSTGNFKAEHWNGNTWDYPAGPGNAGVTAGVGTVGPVTGQTTFSPWALMNIPNPITVDGNTTICAGQSTTLTANGGNSYTWAPTGQTATVIIEIPTANSTYTVTGLNANGCTTDTNITIILTAPPVANATNDTVCLGDIASITASGGGNYLWSTGSASQIISVSPPSSTNYSVIVSLGSCSDTAYSVVTVNPQPNANAGSSVSIILGQSTMLSGSGGNTYAWSPTNSLNNPTISDPVAAPEVTTTYTLVVTDNNGCIDTALVTVYVEIICGDLFIPNAFSPNEDGQNDVLLVRGTCIKDMTLVIYNRWGQKVFDYQGEEMKPEQGWNGDVKEKPENTGVFVYHFSATLDSGESIVKKGNITLLR